MTVTEPADAGYVTVWPCDQPRPNASNLNFVAGATIANAVVAKLDPTGRVCLYTYSATHLIADLNGYQPTDSPAR